MDTLTRIRAFIDVVEAEGFSAAARRTGRSKALLSKYVRELEDELGALLLNRTTRQFSMTEAGHTYYRTASDILKEIDNLADLVRGRKRRVHEIQQLHAYLRRRYQPRHVPGPLISEFAGVELYLYRLRALHNHLSSPAAVL